MKPQRGFTLVEMMITLVILAILLAIGVPSFQQFIRNAQIRTAAESIQAGIQLARAESLRRNSRVTFWLVDTLTSSCALSNSGRSWVVSIQNPTGLCNVLPSDSAAPLIIQTRSGNEGSEAAIVNATSSCITFNGFGRVEAACTGGGNPITNVVISSPIANTRTLQVRVTTGGAIRMCNPDTSIPSTDPSYCGS